MSNVLTIPQKLAQKGDLVIVPRADYEEAMRIKTRLLLEEADTDHAIRVFEKERKEKKLKEANSFADILGIKKPRK